MSPRAKLTRLELEQAYFNVCRERDCWELVWRFPMPDFELSVRREAPTLVTETWYLHASHRASGPVLRVVAADGTESVRFLMHAGVLQPGQLFAFAPEQDPYRTSALHKCQRFANEVAKKDGEALSRVTPTPYPGQTDTSGKLYGHRENSAEAAEWRDEEDTPPDPDVPRRGVGARTPFGRQPPRRSRTSCSCEKPCESFEAHVCKLSQALAVHKSTCEHCRRQHG